MKIIGRGPRRLNGGDSFIKSIIFNQRDDLASEGVFVAGCNWENCDGNKLGLRIVWKWNESKGGLRIDELWSVSLTALSYEEAWMCLLSVVKRSSSGGGGGGWDDVVLGFGAIRFQANGTRNERNQRQLLLLLTCFFSRGRHQRTWVGYSGWLRESFVFSFPFFLTRRFYLFFYILFLT